MEYRLSMYISMNNTKWRQRHLLHLLAISLESLASSTIICIRCSFNIRWLFADVLRLRFLVFQYFSVVYSDVSISIVSHYGVIETEAIVYSCLRVGSS